MIEIEKLPKAKEKFAEFTKNWLLNLYQVLNKEAGTEPVELEDGLVEMQMNNTLQNSRYLLYAFFDALNIFLIVDYADGFYWQVKHKNEANITNIQITEPPKKHETRPSCEEEGFQMCFNILNER